MDIRLDFSKEVNLKCEQQKNAHALLLVGVHRINNNKQPSRYSFERTVATVLHSSHCVHNGHCAHNVLTQRRAGASRV